VQNSRADQLNRGVEVEKPFRINVSQARTPACVAWDLLRTPPITLSKGYLGCQRCYLTLMAWRTRPQKALWNQGTSLTTARESEPHPRWKFAGLTPVVLPELHLTSVLLIIPDSHHQQNHCTRDKASLCKDYSLAGFPRACCRATDNKTQPMGVPPPSII